MDVAFRCWRSRLVTSFSMSMGSPNGPNASIGSISQVFIALKL